MYSHIERRRMPVARFRASRWLAWLSFAVALALIGVLAFQAGTFNTLVPEAPSEAKNDTAPEAPGAPAAKEMTVSQSRFTGFDREQRPFSVTAKNAVQDENDASKVRLVEVAAEMKRKSGQDVSISSQRALYDADSKTIALQGQVTITSADGFVAKMDKAQVNIEKHWLRSETPVEVVYANGVIRSNGMEIVDDGARILFFNRVKATFGGNGRKGSLQ
jgi:lipopolysaccharide export system protein LptC